MPFFPRPRMPIKMTRITSDHQDHASSSCSSSSSSNSSTSVATDSSPSQGMPLSRVIPLRKRDSTSMASEYLALTDIASSLSTYILNDAVARCSSSSSSNGSSSGSASSSDSSCCNLNNIDEDAKLLLNLKDVLDLTVNMNAANSSSKNAHPAPYISSSLSFEAKKHFQGINSSSTSASHANVKPHTASKDSCRINDASPSNSNSNSTRNTFTFSCPSLSLENNMTQSTSNVSLSNNSNNNHNLNQTQHHQQRTPAQLFSRPIHKHAAFLHMNDVAETLANNVMQSFITALDWRAKIWIQHLSKSITTKFYQDYASAMVSSSTSSSPSSTTTTATTINASSNRLCPKKLFLKKGTQQQKSKLKKEQTIHTTMKEKWKKSNEARIIKSLSQAASTIAVHDVRTTFFVLEQQQLNHADPMQMNSTSTNHDNLKSTIFRPYKKRRTTVTDDEHSYSSSSSLSSTTSAATTRPSSSEYTLSHALNVDSRCTISTSKDEKMSISLQTPGTILGTFVRNQDGEVILMDVSIQLDTQSLALSIEQKSRYVVRTAAQECIIAPPFIPPTSTSASTSISSSNVNVNVQQNGLALHTAVKQNGLALRIASEALKNDKKIKLASSNHCGDEPKGSEEKSHPNNESFASTPNTPPQDAMMSHNNHNYYNNQYVDNAPLALVTPNELLQPRARDYNSSDCDSEDTMMPPPPPRLPLENDEVNVYGRNMFLNPRRVSPTTSDSINKNVLVDTSSFENHNTNTTNTRFGSASYSSSSSSSSSDALISLTGTPINVNVTTLQGPPSDKSLKRKVSPAIVSPPLVSPCLTAIASGFERQLNSNDSFRAANHDNDAFVAKTVIKKLGGAGPLMPALVEVACAAHTMHA